MRTSRAEWGALLCILLSPGCYTSFSTGADAGGGGVVRIDAPAAMPDRPVDGPVADAPPADRGTADANTPRVVARAMVGTRGGCALGGRCVVGHPRRGARGDDRAHRDRRRRGEHRARHAAEPGDPLRARGCALRRARADQHRDPRGRRRSALLDPRRRRDHLRARGLCRERARAGVDPGTSARATWRAMGARRPCPWRSVRAAASTSATRSASTRRPATATPWRDGSGRPEACARAMGCAMSSSPSAAAPAPWDRPSAAPPTSSPRSAASTARAPSRARAAGSVTGTTSPPTPTAIRAAGAPAARCRAVRRCLAAACGASCRGASRTARRA
jgi:hypothetical protein